MLINIRLNWKIFATTVHFVTSQKVLSYLPFLNLFFFATDSIKVMFFPTKPFKFWLIFARQASKLYSISDEEKKLLASNPVARIFYELNQFRQLTGDPFSASTLGQRFVLHEDVDGDGIHVDLKIKTRSWTSAAAKGWNPNGIKEVTDESGEQVEATIATKRLQ